MTHLERLETEQISTAPLIYRIKGFSGEKHPDLIKKLAPLDLLPMLGEVHRRMNRIVTFTSGTYDMIHIGHGRYLELARALGDVLVIGLNSDKSVKSYKGPERPILEEIKRAEMLAFLRCVDYITLYDEDSAEGVIRLLKPDCYLCVEGSWEGGWEELKSKPEVVAMAEHGGKVFCSPRQEPGLSTSSIIDKLTLDGKYHAFQEMRKLLDQQESDLPKLITL